MRKRSLWPREHGAYFQLAIPLVTALCTRTPPAASFAIAIGAMLAFLANEPLLVVLGHRGHRRQSVDGARARIRLAGLSIGAVALGATGLVLAPAAITAAAIVAVPTLAVLAFAWRRAEHTITGELVAAIALTGASLPVLAASGASLASSLEIWLGWSVGFGATVFAVHRVIARHKSSAAAIDRGLAASMIALAVGAASEWSPLVVALPLVGVSAALVIAPPAASRLRAIGVAIVIAAIGTSGLVLAAF